MNLQTGQPTLIQELLKLGVLTRQNGQIVLDRSFQEVLQSEMCHSGTDQKRSMASIMHAYFPDLDISRIANYAAFLEAYILQN